MNGKILKVTCFLPRRSQWDPALWDAIEQADESIQVNVYYAEKAQALEDETKAGAPPLELSDGGRGGRVWEGQQKFRDEALACISSDVTILAGYASKRMFALACLSRLRGIPAVLMSDEVREMAQLGLAAHVREAALRFQSWVYAGAFVPGAAARELQIARGWKASRICEGLYSVDGELWQNSSMPLDHNEGELPRASGYRFLVVAKFVPREGVDLCLDAFAHYVHTGGDGCLVVVGDGPDRASLTTKCESLGISDRVQFKGWVAYSDLPTVVGEADVFIHLPRREPWGITIVEATAKGVPWVASERVGAAKDVKGRTGVGHVVGDDAVDISTALALAAKESQSKSCREEYRRASRWYLTRETGRRLAEYLRRLQEGAAKVSAR